MERDLYGAIRDSEATHWWYQGRRAIVFDWLREAIAAHPSPRVLDLGCGTGFNLERLALDGVRGVGADISPEALAFCVGRRLRHLVRADAANPPFRSESFDAVLALDVIEHVQDDERTLRALHAILRPGGTLLIFTPAFEFLWSLQDEVSHHFRRYRAPELRSKLTAAGFEIEKLSYANTLLFPVVWAGRQALKVTGAKGASNENRLHPAWSNTLLARVFALERPLLRLVSTLPFGVSLFAVAHRR